MASRNFFSQLLKIPDVRLQAKKLAHWLEENPLEEVSETFENALLEALRGEQDLRRLLNPYLLTHVSLELLPVTRKQELYEYCNTNNLFLTASLFADFSPQKLGPALGTFRIEDVRLDKAKKKDAITLGERRTLAKSLNIKILEKLLFDPDERVTENLLNNPKILQKHVLLICSRKPTRAAVLRVVSCHRKWGKDTRVRQALIQNPYTPPLLATVGLITASYSELREIAHLQTIHPTLRLLAEIMLKHRKEGAPDLDDNGGGEHEIGNDDTA